MDSKLDEVSNPGWHRLINYLSTLVDEDGLIAEGEVEVFLGGERERRRIDGAREDGEAIGRKEPLPDGVGLGDRPKEGGHQTEAARVPRSGERDYILYAPFWQLIKINCFRHNPIPKKKKKMEKTDFSDGDREIS
ncbi:hypothetical protein TorRG33x02_010530, partial [Trema orientale]